jgi:hypothetical protein
MGTDVFQGIRNRKRSLWIWVATFVIGGFWILSLLIWFLVRPDPIPEGGDHTAAMTEVFGFVEDANQGNYFSRKLALMRLRLKVDQLTDYTVTKDFVDPIKLEYGDRIFSRKEWLGF